MKRKSFKKKDNKRIFCHPLPLPLMAEKLAHDTVVPYSESNQSKKEQVAAMFDSIAGRYDFLNRFLSGRLDIIWRKKALHELKEINPALLLDVATGTADVAIMAAHILAPQQIIGIDISEKMLEIGRKKVEEKKLDKTIQLLKGDSETINFANATFDAVTVAFGIRNFENLQKGLSEIYRVLKPGGKLVILEFSKPHQSGFKKIYKWYMNHMAPRIGKIFSNSKEAYSYLHHSIEAFPEGRQMVAILNQIGFTQTSCKTLSLGICSIYCASK